MNHTLEIARLPLSVVQGAFAQYHHQGMAAWQTKSAAVQWLALQVEAGVLTFDNIRNAKPVTKAALPGVAPAQPAVSVGEVGILADKAELARVAAEDALRTAKAALSGIAIVDSKLTTKTENILNEVASISAQIAAKDAELRGQLADLSKSLKPDTTSVQYEVAKAVHDAFAPFRKVVDDASAHAAVAEASSVVPLGLRPTSEVFGIPVLDIKGRELQVEVWSHPDAPSVDPDFIWTEPILRHLILSSQTGENLWFGGEKGTGKSETARQFAARTGRAFKRINFHKHTSAEEYVGAVGLVDGQTVFQPKDFLLAYTSPSTVILLDEVTNADPGELAPLNGFLEPNAAVSFGGQTHRRAPGVLVFAADNTFGNGDDTGRHVGTRLQNSALIDRFSRVIPFTFLPEDQEADAIVRRTGCSRPLAVHVLGAVNMARQKVQNAEIVDAPSIRSAMAFIRALPVLPIGEAWQTAVVARQPVESHAELNSIFTACINADFINQNI